MTQETNSSDMEEESTQATLSVIEGDQLKLILEAALLAAGQPLSHAQLGALFVDEERPAGSAISKALEQLSEDCEGRGIELTEVASGYRLQVKQEFHGWVSRLWKERPQKYSRALLETMSLIAYRQPITRGEIEAVRGVAVSTSIIRTLQEREWIRVVGHRDVPGKPALFGTTKIFLDYFNLQNLDDLPTLAEIRDMENLEPELQLEPAQTDIDSEQNEETDESDLNESDDDESGPSDDLDSNVTEDDWAAAEELDIPATVAFGGEQEGHDLSDEPEEQCDTEQQNGLDGKVDTEDQDNPDYSDDDDSKNKT